MRVWTMASTTHSHSPGLKEWTGSVFTISLSLSSLFCSTQNSCYLLPDNCSPRFAGPPLVPGVFCGTSLAQNRPWSFQQVTLRAFLMIRVSISISERIFSCWGYHYQLPFGPNNTSGAVQHVCFWCLLSPRTRSFKAKKAARGPD